MNPATLSPSENVCRIDAPMLIMPPKGTNWKDYGGKFANVSEAMQRTFEDAAIRPRND